MKLSVKNVKVHEDMSEETLCFSADLYDNGVLVANVKNSGHGGSNDIRPVKLGVPYTEMMKYDTLEVESEIFDLVIDYDFTTKKQSNHIVLKKNRDHFTAKFNTSIAKIMKTNPDKIRNYVKKVELEGYTVLNRNI